MFKSNFSGHNKICEATGLREALVIKVLPNEFTETINGCIHVVNFVEPSALNLRTFSLLYEEMGSEHQSQLFQTSVRCVSRGKVLARLFELCHEISQFVLRQNNHHLYKHLEHDRLIAKLAHMTDIFEHLNKKFLNYEMTQL